MICLRIVEQLRRKRNKLLSSIKSKRRQRFETNGKKYLQRKKLLHLDTIPTHLVSSEKALLHRLTTSLHPIANVVEIGSFLGASTTFLASALQNTSKVYCIDTWMNDAMSYGQERDEQSDRRDTYEEFLANTAGYKDCIIPLREKSNLAVSMLPSDLKIDLLFIDGDHSYDGVLSDWMTYSPLLADESIVIFHDTEWAIGVNRVITKQVAPKAKLLAHLPNMKAFKISKPRSH